MLHEKGEGLFSPSVGISLPWRLNCSWSKEKRNFFCYAPGKPSVKRKNSLALLSIRTAYTNLSQNKILSWKHLKPGPLLMSLLNISLEDQFLSWEILNVSAKWDSFNNTSFPVCSDCCFRHLLGMYMSSRIPSTSCYTGEGSCLRYPKTCSKNKNNL